MKSHASRRHGSRQRRSVTPSPRAVAAAALLGPLGLIGCDAERLAPPGPWPPESPNAPFELRIRSDDINESRCAVRITASADGGANGAYATWGSLEGRSYDFVTREYVRSRTQPLHPAVFEAPRIETGQTHWGEVDLEWFRREAAEPVLVELELHARLHGSEEGGDGETQVTRLSLSCL